MLLLLFLFACCSCWFFLSSRFGFSRRSLLLFLLFYFCCCRCRCAEKFCIMRIVAFKTKQHKKLIPFCLWAQRKTSIVYACLTNKFCGFLRSHVMPVAVVEKNRSHINKTDRAIAYDWIHVHSSYFPVGNCLSGICSPPKKETTSKNIQPNKTKVENINLLWSVHSFRELLTLKMTKFLLPNLNLIDDTALIWHPFKVNHLKCVTFLRKHFMDSCKIKSNVVF